MCEREPSAGQRNSAGWPCTRVGLASHRRVRVGRGPGEPGDCACILEVAQRLDGRPAHFHVRVVEEAGERVHRTGVTDPSE